MRIYKYIGLQNKDRINYLLRQKKIFHQKPSEFNDPFEMEHRIPVTENVWSKLDVEIREQFPGMKDEIIKSIFSEASSNEDFAEVRIKDFIARGDIEEPTVSCFSSEKSQILMWAHYADSHKVCALSLMWNH